MNALDHYLAEGADQGLAPSPLFDPVVYSLLAGRHGEAADGALDPLQRVVEDATADGGALLARTSWYFDPGWYLERYPDVARAIAAGAWSSPLAHYTGNDTPGAYDPLPQFSEAEYAAANPDVADAVGAGLYRNHYAHYLERGIAERRPLSRDDTPRAPDDARAALEVAGGLYPDHFAYRIARDLEHDGAGLQAPAPANEDQAKTLFARSARLATDAILRTGGLDFTRPDGTPPAVSVVLVLHNQFTFTMNALASLHAQDVAVDLLLVDSGSGDETLWIERHVRGARVIRLDGNGGYIAGCNAAFPLAAAPFVLLLNNDVVLGPGALRAALARIASRPDCGAVGARLVRTHGRMQEAGCILWRDGRTTGHGRDRATDDPTLDFVREVDFCSGAFLLLRTDAVATLGGFDPAFSPAYYEDTDLCFRLRGFGLVTLYDPSVLVTHYEYGSSNATWSAARIARARDLFVRKHADRLRFQYNYADGDYVRARSSRRGERRILFLEDRIPHRHLGSGYVRSNDLVGAMSALGYAVSVFPVLERRGARTGRAGFPDDVELLEGHSARTLASFLSGRPGHYDLLWIGRTHNLRALLPTLAGLTGTIPDFGIVADTEAVVTPREQARARLLHDGSSAPVAATADDALRTELAALGFSQRIVAVSPHDAALIRGQGFGTVDVLGHALEPRPSPTPFGARSGLLFVGALHDDGSPNHDSLRWFVAEILPRLTAAHADLVLTVVGHVEAGVDTGFLRDRRDIRVVGATEDLAPFHAAARVFVAPTRFAAGLPYKIHEAAASGLPVVATSLLCGQLGWDDGAEILDGGALDAETFASAVLRLHDDETLWNTVRDGGLARVAHELAPERFRDDLAAILDATLAGRDGPACALRPAFAPRPIVAASPPEPSAPAAPVDATAAAPASASREPVRLVIWDLDDTFWHGTVTEGGITRRDDTIDIVRALARRGIVSSICSKNDLEPVRDILVDWGIWDQFVFPSINWEPKGPRLKALVDDVQLRPETVLFIDDNPMNRREAAHFVPGLQVADENLIPSMLEDPLFRGKDDASLTRLGQYRLLETRKRDEASTGGDVHAFLRSSNITVEIENDVEAHLDRAIELVNRTNQLNFTKARLPEDIEAARAELTRHLREFYVQAGLVRVRDNYGDYGFVGFFVQHRGAAFQDLAHYCFSCRTLGMHVETWLYRRLGRPRIKVVGPVLTDLFDDTNPVDWIHHHEATPGDAGERAPAARIGRVFIFGGCDLEAVAHYLTMSADDVRTRLNTARDGIEVRLDHTQIAAMAVDGLGAGARAALRPLGYDDADFGPLGPAAENADVWLLSFWADAYYHLFRHRTEGVVVPFSPAQLGHNDLLTLDAETIETHAPSDAARAGIAALREAFEHVGLADETMFKTNLRRVLDAAPAHAHVIINLMDETPFPQHETLADRHRRVNRWSLDVLADHPRVHVLRMSDFVEKDGEMIGPTHYQRMVYLRLAQKVVSLVRHATAPPRKERRTRGAPSRVRAG